MNRAERTMLSEIVRLHEEKERAVAAYSEVAHQVYSLMMRCGPIIYVDGHVIELRGHALEIKVVRSIPAEVLEDAPE